MLLKACLSLQQLRMMKIFRYIYNQNVLFFFLNRTQNSRELDVCTHVHLTNVNNEWNPSTVKFPNGNQKYENQCSQLHILCSALHKTIYDSNYLNLQISVLTTNNKIDFNKKHSFISQKRHGDITPEILSSRWLIGPKRLS